MRVVLPQTLYIKNLQYCAHYVDISSAIINHLRYDMKKNELLIRAKYNDYINSERLEEKPCYVTTTF